ncbi:alpha/beta hydrolase [Hymenobacter sp. BT683]|uniref:Alpha/beta hydrolase n=1 Tax=Hymenobacter jeongseonensis TaxID=2791027 RepID=A0ABS0INA0_9BACT|nr:alpha/beta hydrolase [Hymenobacter jeongseonensis]MBF9239801.1 alpha/beta hydrolase [Hymenobacter jeongseonensis]
MHTTSYHPDVLGLPFEQLVLPQLPDYEGAVQSTLVRLRNSTHGTKAVLYLHGFNDYFFQEEMARRYQEHGYRFYALDLRKYGRSLLPHQLANNVRDLREYYADIDAALAVLRAEGCAMVILSGHSTGGLIAALYAQEGSQRHTLAALVLNSPFLAFAQGWMARHLAVPFAAAVGRLAPNLKVPGSLPIHYGASLHRQYRGEWGYDLAWKPVKVFPITMGWLRAIHTAHRRLQRGEELTLPVLVLHSDRSVRGNGWSEEYFCADGVLRVRDIETLSPRLGKRVTVTSIAGGIHDLVLSPLLVREQVYEKMFTWLTHTLG